MSELKSATESSQETAEMRTQPQLRSDRCYLVSSKFDYEETISSAYGPVYAQHMGWEAVRLDDAESVVRQYPVVLIDPRIDEDECERLYSIVQENRGVLFGFSVIDPYAYVRGRSYPEMLFEVKDEPNVFFLSRYQPKEIVKELASGADGDKLVTIPYAFVEPVLSIENFEERTWKILQSGRLHKDRYPSRQAIFRLQKWLPLFQLFIDVLSHPGYPDIGEDLEHKIVGDAYVEFLSQYAFMFASPSRLRLEFQKYRECAMAGCVPVGIPPDGFHEDMRRPFVEKKVESLLTTAFSLPFVFGMSVKEAKDRAKSYREAYRKHRNPKVLNEKLDSFINEENRI